MKASGKSKSQGSKNFGDSQLGKLSRHVTSNLPVEVVPRSIYLGVYGFFFIGQEGNCFENKE